MKQLSSKDRPVLEAVLESSEVLADTLMKGDLIAEIPIIGAAFKICKAADSIRERAFAEKLAAFISGVDSVDDSKKEKMRERVKSSPEEAKRIGETLFFVLERVTDFDKPAILSKLFLAYIDNVISGQDLRRMAQAIDTAFSDDLQKFIEVKTLPKKSESGWMQHLVSSGLTCAVAGKTFDEAGLLYYEATTLGNKFRTAYLRNGLHGYTKDVEKAKRAKPFEAVPEFSAFTVCLDSTLRNGSHHASIWRDGEKIIYRSGGSGARREIPYSAYIHLCNRATISLAAIWLLEVSEIES